MTSRILGRLKRVDRDDAADLLSARGLTCRYGDYTAVDRVDIGVSRGELFALLGTNGAGKTTTLECLQGHRRASSGAIHVFGRLPSERRSGRRRTGIMLQESGFAPELTALETVRLLGSLSGRKGNASEMLDQVGLSAKASTQVGQLSGGERRRLDFATAAYGAPDLLFLDEPTTGLDVQSREQLWGVVAEMREQFGTTVLLTTHYLEEAEQYADRIAIMHEGRIAVEGSLVQLVEDMPSSLQFRLPPSSPVSPLEEATVEANGLHRVRTQDLQTTLTDLLLWAREHHVDVRDLKAGDASLEDLFRAITTTRGEPS